MIKLGDNDIGKICLGSNEIGKVYLGSKLVFQKKTSGSYRRLPDGYTELAYVVTDSRAFFDTGVAGATDLVIVSKFMFPSYIQYAAVYGNYISEAYKANRIILGSTTSFSVGGGNNLSTTVSGFSLNKVLILTVSSTSATLFESHTASVIGGTTTAISASSGKTNTNHIRLGNNGVENPTVRDTGLRLYAFRINKAGTTVLNLVPAKRDSDNAVGFYDFVSESFMKSDTSTEFTAGPEINYTAVEYIQTDGTAFIGTGLTASSPMSMEMKVQMGGNTACALLSGYTVASGGSGYNFAPLKYANKSVAFSYYYNYGSSDGTPSVAYSVDNDEPFVVRTSLKSGKQSISVKQKDSDSWVTANFTQPASVSTTFILALFNGYQGGSYSIPAPSGTRLYSCKIYGDDTFTTLIRDYVPCVCNGEYGLWDKVGQLFYGNSASSGAFSGPSI